VRALWVSGVYGEIDDRFKLTIENLQLPIVNRYVQNTGEPVMAKGDDIEERLIDFAVKIIWLCGLLPKTEAGKHVSGQLLRCGTSPAPNYGEARGAESRRDFVHKLRIVLKELHESAVWLKISKRAQLHSAEKVDPLLTECTELSKIIGASITTASKN
jgi:four helix bundle protein